MVKSNKKEFRNSDKRNTMIINGQEFTTEQIHEMFNLCSELIKINEDQNAKLIAFDAKLKNEEAKVKELKQKLFFISQAFTNNTYQA